MDYLHLPNWNLSQVCQHFVQKGLGDACQFLCENDVDGFLLLCTGTQLDDLKSMFAEEFPSLSDKVSDELDNLIELYKQAKALSEAKTQAQKDRILLSPEEIEFRRYTKLPRKDNARPRQGASRPPASNPPPIKVSVEESPEEHISLTLQVDEKAAAEAPFVKQARMRPNHFLSVRINDPTILSQVAQMQSKILQTHPYLAPFMIKPVSLHFTLFVMELKDPEQLELAKAVLRSCAPLVQSCLPPGETMELTIKGISNFRDQVVFLCSENGPHIKALADLAASLHAKFREVGIPLENFHFEPHATFMKLSQGQREMKRDQARQRRERKKEKKEVRRAKATVAVEAGRQETDVSLGCLEVEGEEAEGQEEEEIEEANESESVGPVTVETEAVMQVGIVCPQKVVASQVVSKKVAKVKRFPKESYSAFQDTLFGVQEFPCVELSSMLKKGEDGYYLCVEKVDFPQAGPPLVSEVELERPPPAMALEAPLSTAEAPSGVVMAVEVTTTVVPSAPEAPDVVMT